MQHTSQHRAWLDQNIRFLKIKSNISVERHSIKEEGAGQKSWRKRLPAGCCWPVLSSSKVTSVAGMRSCLPKCQTDEKKKLLFFPAAGVYVEIAKVSESAETEDLPLGAAVDSSFPE